MFALQESVCWSETYFPEQRAFCGQVSSMSAVRLGVVVWSPFSRAHFREQRQAESSSLTMFALQESVCWSETYPEHVCRVHVFTLRRTRSTEKLISTGLAKRNYHAGINLKFFNCYKRRTRGLLLVEVSARRSMHFVGKCPA